MQSRAAVAQCHWASARETQRLTLPLDPGHAPPASGPAPRPHTRASLLPPSAARTGRPGLRASACRVSPLASHRRHLPHASPTNCFPYLPSPPTAVTCPPRNRSDVLPVRLCLTPSLSQPRPACWRQLEPPRSPLLLLGAPPPRRRRPCKLRRAGSRQGKHRRLGTRKVSVHEQLRRLGTRTACACETVKGKYSRAHVLSRSAHACDGGNSGNQSMISHTPLKTDDKVPAPVTRVGSGHAAPCEFAVCCRGFPAAWRDQC